MRASKFISSSITTIIFSNKTMLRYNSFYLLDSIVFKLYLSQSNIVTRIKYRYIYIIFVFILLDYYITS